MKPEIRITDSIKTIKGKKIMLTENVANVEDIKSAVEWLKKEPFGYFTENDEACVSCRKSFLKTINNAFENVTDTSGKLLK